MTVRVSEVVFLKLGQFQPNEDPEAKVGAPYALVTLTWMNGTKEELTLLPVVTVTVGAAQNPAPRVIAGDEKDQLVTAPGGTDTWDVAFLVSDTDRKHVVIDVVDGANPAHRVQFSGALQ